MPRSTAVTSRFVAAGCRGDYASVRSNPELLLLLLLVPLVAALRMFWVLPWVVEATYGDEALGAVGVRGWKDSEERIREIAAAYQRGEDPFLADLTPRT